MILLPIILTIFLSYSKADPYVPGNPGAAWSAEELIIVKSKLFSIFNSNGGYKALGQIYEENPAGWIDVPDAPKALRLGFHDCLR